MKTTFNIHEGDSTYQVTDERLVEFASFYGLEKLAQGRYTSLFVLNLMLLQRQNGVDPSEIIDEIKSLEGLVPSCQTKPASRFTGSHLKGLWHKHFFTANMSLIAHNIRNQLERKELQNLVNLVIDPGKNPIVTAEMINELSHRVVVESLRNRAAQGKLTGEWIVFAKHQGKNYYLCIAAHESGDENIANSIKVACVPQFPFLASYVS